ncbi:MAG: glycosyltransferase [Muribaculaceae bacterium]|nr:glycosyltransferase [Muribaculaceae bacterium]
MRIVIVNKSDCRGGAAIVSKRLMEAFRAEGIDARMVVAEKLSDSEHVAVAAPGWKLKSAFLAERLQIFIANGFNRSDLFKVDTANFGVDILNHPWVKEADVVMLNWINQGFISLKEIRKLANAGKRLIWTMHDLWEMTGICHHSDGCSLYQGRCEACHFLSKKGRIENKPDLSSQIQTIKQRLYKDVDIKFVAVSTWLRDLAKKSTLLKDQDVRVIPNAFNPLKSADRKESEMRRRRIVMGAARLDDPVKGLSVMVEATKIFARRWPTLAEAVELITYGDIRDAEKFEGIAISHRHLGRISGEKAIAELYSDSDIVLSTSEYETLPGTLIEGQAYGAVPVSLDRGGQRDIVDNGVTGFLAEYHPDPKVRAERIAEALHEALLAVGPDIRRQMRESVKVKFSAQEIAKAYLQLLKE